jgi:probable phosphoglycerate mutase
MSDAELWLVRHGETAWSATGQHTSVTEMPLTTTGEEQALALRRLLADEHFSLVESSPRERARRTAELAGFQPTIDDDLAEWDYGELEGLTIDQIRARYPGWTIWDGPWPGGEGPDQVAARASRVVERARALPEGGKTVVFAHGHILRALAAIWLRQPVAQGRLFGIGTATVGVLSWEHGAPVVGHWNIPPAFPGPSPASPAPPAPAG